MSELLIVALICASTLAAGDCRRDTALDVVTAPASGPMDCMMRGQTMIAGGALAEQEGTYLKVACERRTARVVASGELTAARP